MIGISDDTGSRIQMLRRRSGLSLRRLAGRAAVSPGLVSSIERGRSSPSIATLRKILMALGTDLGTFFAGDPDAQTGPVFLRERMNVVSDAERSYTMVFPRRENVTIQLLDEQMAPARRRPPFEKLNCDVAGYIISGSLVMEIKGKGRQMLRPGDAFYVPRGLEHRGYAHPDEPVRLITVYSPPRY